MLRKVIKSPWMVSAVIAVITLTVFWRVLITDFVMWDDNVIIYENPNVQGVSLERLGKIFTDVDSMMRYNPLTLLGWSITYEFCKTNPFWYHLVNWLLHGLNAALVFLVLRRLLVLGLAARSKANADRWQITISSALAALLWSLHPLRVEPVAWCTDRTYCQAMFFMLLSLLCYLRAGEAGEDNRRHYQLLTVSVVLYIISLLSYAIVMTFFLVLLVLDIYPLGKLGGINGWWKTATARRTLLEKIPFAAAAGAVAFITVCIRIASAGVWKKPVSLAEFGVFQRFMQAMYIWAYYLWRHWYPFNLSPVYTTLVSFDPMSPAFIISAALVIGVITLLVLFRRRWPLGLALGVCHLALLVPVLGIFEHPHYPCDRYSLIVSILWSVLLAAWLASPGTKPLIRNIGIVLSVIVIAGLGTLSYHQTRIWNNSVSLFEYTIRILGDDPYSYDIHWRLAKYLEMQGQTGKSIEHLKQAVKIHSGSVDLLSDLGTLLIRQKKFDEALVYLNNAMKAEPNRANIYLLLGEIYFLRDRPQKTIANKTQAIEAFKRAIKLKPDFAGAHYNLGVVFLETGDRNSAMEQYEILKKLNPGMANMLSSKIAGKD